MNGRVWGALGEKGRRGKIGKRKRGTEDREGPQATEGAQETNSTGRKQNSAKRDVTSYPETLPPAFQNSMAVHPRLQNLRHIFPLREGILPYMFPVRVHVFVAVPPRAGLDAVVFALGSDADEEGEVVEGFGLLLWGLRGIWRAGRRLGGRGRGGGRGMQVWDGRFCREGWGEE